MKATPTAGEFLLIKAKHSFRTAEERMECNMIEFAKLHVEAQREAIKLKLEMSFDTTFQGSISLVDDFEFEQSGNDLIDNAYPLTNIK